MNIAENKTVNMLIRILRIVLAIVALILGGINGSYRIPVKETDVSTEVVRYIETNYFDMQVFETNWCPMICMILTLVAVAVAVYCVFKETENSLTLLTNMYMMAMVANLITLIFLTLTPIGWCITFVLGAGLTITAVQEMRMEDAKKRH